MDCRKQGLESRRRCGFIAEEKRVPPRLVWVSGRAAVQECPKTFVITQSTEFVERFLMWKASGARDWASLTAREADAFGVLEEEWRAGADTGGMNGE